MLRIGEDEETISKTSYREGPLFKEFRKSDIFINTYEKIFKEPFLEEQPSLIEPLPVTDEKTQNIENVDNN